MLSGNQHAHRVGANHVRSAIAVLGAIPTVNCFDAGTNIAVADFVFIIAGLTIGDIGTDTLFLHAGARVALLISCAGLVALRKAGATSSGILRIAGAAGTF